MQGYRMIATTAYYLTWVLRMDGYRVDHSEWANGYVTVITSAPAARVAYLLEV